MSHDLPLLQLAVRFTETYRQTPHLPKAQREILCERVNLPGILLPPLTEDLFAGRRIPPVAGFWNQYFPSGPMSDAVGYYFDADRARTLLERSGQQDSGLAARIKACEDFWATETSERHITTTMDDEMRQALPSPLFGQDSAVSHRLYRIASTGVDLPFLFEQGIPGLRSFYADAAGNTDEAVEVDFCQAAVDFCDLLSGVLAHYAEQTARLTRETPDLTRRAELNRMAQALHALQERPPESFFEAVQLFHLFTLIGFYCHCFGRLDDSLGGFLARDLASGVLEEEEAIGLLLNLWHLMNEHFGNSRITLGGEGRRDPESADVFTRLALEATRRFYRNFSPRPREYNPVFALCPQVALRVSSSTPEDIRELAFDVLADGSTFPLMYNDDVNIPAVAHAFRIPETDAADYTFFDCGEYVIDKQSIGTPSCIINLPKALELALHQGVDPKTGEQRGPRTPPIADLGTFEAFWEAYHEQVRFATEQSARFQKHAFDCLSREGSFVAMSLLQPGSRETRRGILDGGCPMLGGTFETYGNITAADALLALKQLVYEQKLYSLEQIQLALELDFTGHEDLHRAARAVPKFGNDQPEADAMAVRVHEHICHLTRDQAERVGLHHFLAVVINNGANVIVGHHVGATADGRREGAPVSNGNTPTAGNDVSGITALLNSIVKLTPDLHAGAVHNLRFSKRSLLDHPQAIRALLDTYFVNGGTQYMVTVTSREELEDARVHPENYGHLLVRMGGFSARFVDLPDDMQLEVIARHAY